ncbi:MAG: hypothetical protein AVO33_04355 [delta proteobacterium ML8_F1]|nr:MAG: hypothetical protein AVO33_04355 [delta proteobacterium ML8_F1]
MGKTGLIVGVLLILLTVSGGTFAQSLYGIDYSDEVFKVGFDPNLPPYQYKEDGEYKGFNLDLIRRIALEYDLEIELIPMALNEALVQFENKELDMVLGIRFIRNMEETMDFSDSLVQSTVSLVIPKDREEAIKEKLNMEPFLISVEWDSPEYEFVKNIKKANYNLAFNQENVIDLLLMGRADVMIGVRHVAEYTFEKFDIEKDYIISNLYESPVDYYVGITKDYPGLLTMVNNTLRDIKISGEYEAIYNRWINDKTLERQKVIVEYLMLVLFTALGILFVIVVLNRQLKKRILDKTEELRLANQELEEKIIEIWQSNDLKNLILESSPRAIIIFDTEGKIMMMNEMAVKHFGEGKNRQGETVFSMASVSRMLENCFDGVIHRGERFMGEEYEHQVAGRTWTYRYALYPLYNYLKAIGGAILTIEDITDEMIVRAEAEERKKHLAMTQLIASIAHEIRNPLTSIKTYMELLPRKISNEKFQNQIATVVPKEVDRVDRLIQQLIDYSKPRDQDIVDVEVKSLVEYCLFLFQPLLEEHGIQVKTRIQENLIVRVDADQMRQALINLIVNSMDAINEMKQEAPLKEYLLSLSSFKEGPEIKIIVEDNGIGMTKEELQNVFELFYTTKSRGSGIGLPLFKELIEKNKGRIEISSVKNEGTRVVVILEGGTHEE